MSLGSSDYSMGMAVGAVVGAAATAIACALTNLNSRNDDGNGNGVRLPVAGGGMAKAQGEPRAPQYHSGVIKVKEGMLDQYTALHDHTWDQVMAKMHEANMRNFVVYYHEELSLMFHHWEYVGDDFEADMAKCDNDPIILFWWTHCEPCQEPLHWTGPPPSQGGGGDPKYPGQWWSPMVQLNHCGGWPIAWSNSWPNPDHVPANKAGKTTSLEHPPPVHNRPAAWTTPYNRPNF